MFLLVAVIALLLLDDDAAAFAVILDPILLDPVLADLARGFFTIVTAVFKDFIAADVVGLSVDRMAFFFSCVLIFN